MRLVILSAFIALLHFAASAQTLVSASSILNDDGKAVYRVTVQFTPTPFPKTPVTGAPYSADEVFEAIQPDGSPVQHGEPLRSHARDSQGRTRVERSLYLGPNVPETPRIIEITDVVAGFSYTLDPQNKIAHRARRPLDGAVAPLPVRPEEPAAVAIAGPGGRVTKASPDETREVAAPAVAERPGASPTVSEREQLPSRTIEGQVADGTRFTTASSSVATSEVWTSRELGIVLSTRIVDAGNGQRITSMKNVVRAEPDHGLFVVPPGYAIRDEAGRFTIELTLQQ